VSIGGYRGGRREAHRQIANQDRLERLGEAVKRHTGGGSRPASHSRRTWIRRGVIAVGLVLVLVVGGVIADYYYLGSLVNRQKIGNLQSGGSAENILLIGSTTRCGLKVQNKAYGLCSQGVTGVNSDIDMILHLDPATGSVSLLSVPRDLFVPNARIIGANKIDAALYQGPSQLVAAIEEDFAIPINHYVELNFDTFANVVDALGGVSMDFPVPIYDQESGLNIERPGCYLLNGVRALEVVRSRHLQIQPDASNHQPSTWPKEGLSDLARIRRTHEFLRVLSAKVSARGIGDPLTDQSIATSVLPDLTVDNGFSESTMVNLAKSFAHTNIANVLQLTYPIVTVETGSYLYKGYYYGDVEFPVQPNGTQTIDQILGISPSTNAFTGAALPSPSSFTISIKNATGIANQAAIVSRELAAKGFRVSSTGDMAPVGKVGETVVWYGGPRPPLNGNWASPSLAAAQAVLAQLQGPAILGYNPAEVTPGASVTVQTGTGLTMKAASRTSTTSTSKHKKSSTSTSTTVYDPPGVKSNNSFSAPSLVNQALEPYDPRACNAAGTGPATTTALK
jgi:LCP family protein required for cell wall assembly